MTTSNGATPQAPTADTPPGDLNLIDFTVADPSDPLSTVLGLVHDQCGEVLCDVAPDETLHGLLDVAGQHVCADQPHWHVLRHPDDEDTLTRRFTSLFNALAYAGQALDAAAEAEAQGAADAHDAAVAAFQATLATAAAGVFDGNGDELTHYREMTDMAALAEQYGRLVRQVSEVVSQNLLPVNSFARKPLYRGSQAALLAAAEDTAALINSELNPNEFHIWQATETCQCNRTECQ
jgi:hypothetical protein